MLFNSIEFALFFPIVTIVFFILQHKHRWWWLLASSCYFYMAFKPEYILILGFTIVVDYFAGIYIEKSTGSLRKWYLIASLIANIGVLAVFKYYNFFTLAIGQSFGVHFKMLEMLLPIGLSFHTFQAMSYTIEVYRGNQKAEKHFGIYALYVMFYPQLVAGPIERPQNILHQFYKPQVFDYERVKNGLLLMAWGLFKKVVIADRLAQFVDVVYNHPTEYVGLPIIVATIFFTFQIFCDFSGYSDIALGSAQVMGFKLMKNFDRPYFSKSISEFWRRWHISLSTWFRDYLYIPLGGNRVGVSRRYFNLFFVFAVSGLWHGANWNFIIWGALHGFYLIFALLKDSMIQKFEESKIFNFEERGLVGGFIKTIKKLRIIEFSNTIITFILVAFAWIFFRADYIEMDWCYHLVGNLFTDLPTFSELLNRNYLEQNVFLGKGMKEFSLAILFIIFMEVVHYFQRNQSIRVIISEKPLWVRWSIYYIFIMIFIFFGVFDNPAQFIYFQF